MVINSTHRRRMNYARTWLRPEPSVPQPRQVADRTAIVFVSNEFFEAEAVWVRRSNVWACSDADPELEWMMGMERLAVKNELLRRGCKWRWRGK